MYYVFDFVGICIKLNRFSGKKAENTHFEFIRKRKPSLYEKFSVAYE